jgi:hypothetical protein
VTRGPPLLGGVSVMKTRGTADIDPADENSRLHMHTPET